jgi:feruloyl esterase
MKVRTIRRGIRFFQAALETWTAGGAAPESIVTTKYVDDDPTKGAEMTRPLCPYPLAAKYKGQGDTNKAENFVCSQSQ